MAITTDDVKALRDQTGVSVMQCKKALEEADGDREKALTILRKVSGDIAGKKATRALGAGTVAAYVHSTKTIASLVMLSSETDFVAKNEEFVKLAYDIAMQVAATNPQFLSRTEAPGETPPEHILLEQSFIKDPARNVRELIEAATQKFGERIEVAKFVRLTTSE